MTKISQSYITDNLIYLINQLEFAYTIYLFNYELCMCVYDIIRYWLIILYNVLARYLIWASSHFGGCSSSVSSLVRCIAFRIRSVKPCVHNVRTWSEFSNKYRLVIIQLYLNNSVNRWDSINSLPFENSGWVLARTQGLSYSIIDQYIGKRRKHISLKCGDYRNKYEISCCVHFHTDML